MRTTSLFGAFSFLFLVIIAALAGLTLWNINRSAHWDTRVKLAQDSYHEHLALESNIFQLLKQHGDALLIGDRDEGALEAELKARIAGNIATIRDLIAREIELVGEEEFEELALLAAIERQVAELTRALVGVTEGEAPVGADIREERLVDLLDREIDGDLTRRIDAALAEEQEEVTETLAEATAFRDRTRAVLIVLSILACTLVLSFGLAYLRLIRRPLDELGSVLTRFGQGDWAADTRIAGGTEFRALGRVLGEMAEGLARRESSRQSEADRLEAKVAARTAEQKKLLVQIERTEAKRRQLLADISHELRTPLTIIQGEADVTLRSGERDARVYQDALARIRDSARHTNRIVDDLLLISRQEAGELRLERRETDLALLTAEASEMFGGPVTLHMPDLPVRAFIDRLRLRQCLIAVFQNARRYGGPTIAAHVETIDGMPRIVVEDDGPGMSDAEKDQAFDRFFRGSNVSDGGEGHGLGLPIVRSIVDAHGGQIALEDAHGGGLRVVISLPRRPGPALVAERIQGAAGTAANG